MEERTMKALAKLETENKTYMLYVRVSPRQRILLNNAARLDGRTLTGWIRRAALTMALAETVK